MTESVRLGSRLTWDEDRFPRLNDVKIIQRLRTQNQNPTVSLDLKTLVTKDISD